MNEDKQKILDLLLPSLQATRNLHDLIGLDYDEESGTVIATFNNGYQKRVNVAIDSGTAMICYVIRQIV